MCDAHFRFSHQHTTCLELPALASMLRDLSAAGAVFAHTSPANFLARRALPSTLPGTDEAPPALGRVGVASELEEAPELPAPGETLCV